MIFTSLNPVSIVIPIKNRANLLPSLIKNITNLDYPEIEIIIVDDCSTDNTKELLKHYPITSIILKESVGSAEARNIGIRQAKNDIIALTDSDCFVSKNWLKFLVPYLNVYDVIGGKVKFCDPTENKLNPFNADNEIMLTKDTYINFLNTSNMILKKETWKLSGGFMDFRIEDLEFSWRLLKKGYTLFYSPKGLVIHHGNRSPLKNIEKYIQYGKSYCKIASIYKMSFMTKTDPIINPQEIFNYLILLFLPSLLLLIFNFFAVIKNELIFIITSILLLLSLVVYLILQYVKKLDVFFKIYKMTITFSIIVYSVIYILKK